VLQTNIFAPVAGLSSMLLGHSWPKDFCVPDFKKLQSLELCGGGITDTGVSKIKDLTLLTSLNLSQNLRITDNALQYLSGMKSLVSLNLANSRVTNAGLHHLRPLTSLTSLALQGCKVTRLAVDHLQATSLPSLAVIRLK
jgi:Leucine-rich repeat (LRR) protein